VEQNDGSIVKQMWVKCKKCAHKAKAYSSNGTKAFINHLKPRHKILKGQQHLTHNGDTIATYKYEENFSVRLLYYAIIMHEYPFSIAQHKLMRHDARSSRRRINLQITSFKEAKITCCKQR
jgi:hypothetical protein